MLSYFAKYDHRRQYNPSESVTSSQQVIGICLTEITFSLLNKWDSEWCCCLWYSSSSSSWGYFWARMFYGATSFNQDLCVWKWIIWSHSVLKINPQISFVIDNNKTINMLSSEYVDGFHIFSMLCCWRGGSFGTLWRCCTIIKRQTRGNIH